MAEQIQTAEQQSVRCEAKALGVSCLVAGLGGAIYKASLLTATHSAGLSWNVCPELAGNIVGLPLLVGGFSYGLVKAGSLARHAVCKFRR